MYQITVDDIEIDVIRKDIKNLHLAVYPPNGRVRLAIPLQIDEEAIHLFVKTKLTWIKNQQRKFLEQERETEREYLSRESHYFFGKRYLLDVIEYKGHNKVELDKEKIKLYVRKSSTKLQRNAVMNEWYRRELKIIIPDLIKKWEKIIDVSVSGWGVRLMKTKWGSCNTDKKTILLNLELAKKPIICLEFIIVHELVHLLERLHNDNFIHYMDLFMPQWRKYRDELNNLPISHANWNY